MRILMLVPNVPFPPKSGGRMRMWEQIRHLGRRHDLTLVACAFTREDLAGQEALEEHCARVLIVPHRQEASDAVSQGLPWLLRQYASQSVRETLEPVRRERFDLLLVANIFMAAHRPLFPVPAALDEYNIESDLVRQTADLSAEGSDGRSRAFRRASWLHLRRYEDETWPQFPLRFVVSERDREEIIRRCPGGRTVIVENGIDVKGTPYSLPVSSGPILFMGTFEYPPNVGAALDFARDVFPLVRRGCPDARFVVAGRRPPPEIRGLAADPNIEVIADPDDMQAVAARCALTVAPLRIGGGTRIKILHALAMGLPAVSTTIGCEGLDVTEGRDILVRDEPAPFADAVCGLLKDPARAAKLSRNGRALVERRYDWPPILDRMESELLNLAASSPAH